MKTNKNKTKSVMYIILSYVVVMVPVIITMLIIGLPVFAEKYEVCKDILSLLGSEVCITIITLEFLVIFPLGVWIMTILMSKVYRLENNNL